MKTAICFSAAVLVGVLLFAAAKLNNKNTSLSDRSRQNDHREHDINRDRMMRQALADGARHHSIADRNDREYNTFFVVRKDHPDKYSICSHLWIESKNAVAGKDFLFFVKYVSADEDRPDGIRLYYGMSGGYTIWTSGPLFQKATLVKAADRQLSWGKFFCKTTTSPEAKIASSENELAAGESGYFLFPMYSRDPISPVDFGRVIDLIKKPVSHN